MLPTLGIERQAGEAALDDRVEAILHDFLETDEVVRDDDGDRPVRCGDAMVFVRVVEETRYVSVFSPALRGVTATPALLEAVNDFNLLIRVARAAVVDTTVVISAEVDDQPGLDAAVVNAIQAVAMLSRTCVDELQPRVGGQAFFEEGDRPAEPAPEPGYGLYL